MTLAEQKHRERATLSRLKFRGIVQENWLDHLDEMSDSEITLMLDLTEGKAYMDEDRKAYPKMSDRTRAEFLRDS